jgi:UDP-GlcNAc:undecaprenyl-phosphate GlcNAc-1-phosphate transferase
MTFISTLLITMVVTIILIPICKSIAVRNNVMDFPNPRKVHTRPMPKIGGIAMAVGALGPTVLWATGCRMVSAVIIGAWIIVIFGVLDDFKNLGYKGKFVGQVLAALVVIFIGGLKIKGVGNWLPDGALLPDLIAIPLTLVVIVGVTNAINLSDGLDGLAGGNSLLIFICIGYLAYTGQYRPENHLIMVLCAAIIGAIFGFLRFNTYPATVFMGDAGSQLLGFLAITLSLGLTQGNTPLSPALPLILLGFPVLDTLTVMIERILNRRSPFKADQNHFHHKLIRLGFFHTEAVVTIYLLTVFLVFVAFIFRFYSEWFLLFFYIAFSGIIIGGFVAADRTGWKLQRYTLIDGFIKGKLRIFKEKHIVIKVSFQFVENAVPLLLIVTSILPTRMPPYFSVAALILAVITLWTSIFMKKWLTAALRLSFYLMVPFILRLGQLDMVSWMNYKTILLYNLSFGVLALFVVLTLKFTRRREGFKATPIDFLLLVIALVLPNLPDPQIQNSGMGFLATKIIVLFFSFEVLIGELRGKLTQLSMANVVALLVVSFKGLTG